MNKLFVISLGGSLINPGEIDTVFIKNFIKLLAESVRQGNKFIVVTGGGGPARQYQKALRDLGNTKADTLDWMGIYTTRVNARLMQLALSKLAYQNIVKDPSAKFSWNKPILVASGWKPGRSTDFVSVMLGKTYGAQTIINLSNIDYVYDKDPRKFKTAKKITKISWKNFKIIVGTKWNPGANVPFDPTAAKFAEQHKLRVIIANGKNLANLKNILSSKPFQGTTVQ